MEQVDERFNRIEKEQIAMREMINKIFNQLDHLSKRIEISDDERLVMGHQLDRLDKWTRELADKIGHKLSV